ncbi:MAG: hypothetical protein LUE17_14820 [Planctomycetaceae bacterium]|nr:hypothetical protein [Planctomycetaceae bacterium]
MKTKLCILILAAATAVTAACGFDVPDGVSFQLGFRIRVLPGPKDTSRQRGLIVQADRIYSDKTRRIAVAGTITNFSDIPCENVDMRFAVSSYVGTGYDRGRATVEPTTIMPGCSANFSVHISLGSERPRNALYTITATSPVLFPDLPPDGAPVELAPEIFDVLISPDKTTPAVVPAD